MAAPRSTATVTTTPKARRAATKPAARPAAKKAAAKKAPTRRPAAKPAAAAPAAEAAAQATNLKAEKQKLVRDSFTIPAGEYEQIAALKQRGIALGRPVKKSELLRAGLKALAALADKPLLAVLDQVPAIKTGRPKSKKKDKAEKAPVTA
jgi:hypothetical protein